MAGTTPASYQRVYSETSTLLYHSPKPRDVKGPDIKNDVKLEAKGSAPAQNLSDATKAAEGLNAHLSTLYNKAQDDWKDVDAFKKDSDAIADDFKKLGDLNQQIENASSDLTT